MYSSIGVGGVLDPVSSGGTGGTFVDEEFKEFSGANRTSTYHIYAGHLNTNEPFGVLVWLHGDGAYEAKNSANDSYLLGEGGVLTLARERNLLLVVPKTPELGSDNKPRWWQDSKNNVAWLFSLIEHLAGLYDWQWPNFWIAGFSGGAEVQTYEIIPNSWLNTLPNTASGGLIIIGGGGAYVYPYTGITRGVSGRFSLNWFVGENDTGAEDPNDPDGVDAGFDAVTASLKGYDHLTNLGWTTRRDLIPNRAHLIVDANGKAEYGYYIARAMDRPRPRVPAAPGVVTSAYLGDMQVAEIWLGRRLLYSAHE